MYHTGDASMSDTELIEQFNRDGYVAIENEFNLDEV